MNWSAVVENMVADLLLAVVGGLLVFAISAAFVLSARARRLNVLQIRGVSELRLPIYIAHLVVLKHGAQLTDGTPSRYFEGSAVPLPEVNVAAQIAKLLHSSLVDVLPKILQRRLARWSTAFIKITVDIQPAPLDTTTGKEARRPADYSPAFVWRGGSDKARLARI
jgi:hypothetical protein